VGHLFEEDNYNSFYDKKSILQFIFICTSTLQDWL